MAETRFGALAYSRLVLELRSFGEVGWELGSAADHVQLQKQSVGVFAALSALYWGWVAFVMWYDDQCKKKANI